MLTHMLKDVPECPVCAEPAVGVSVGVTLNERAMGNSLVTARPDPLAPPRFECPNGHWFVSVDGKQIACGEPCQVEVIHDAGWRRP